MIHLTEAIVGIKRPPKKKTLKDPNATIYFKNLNIKDDAYICKLQSVKDTEIDYEIIGTYYNKPSNLKERGQMVLLCKYKPGDVCQIIDGGEDDDHCVVALRNDPNKITIVYSTDKSKFKDLCDKYFGGI